MVIFATESADDASKSRITKDVIDHVSTHIYLPNQQASSAYQDVFGLTDTEFTLLTEIESNKRRFLLKHGQDAIVASLDLGDLEELAVLAGDDDKVAIMEAAIAETGPEPDAWLPEFYRRVH